MATRFAVLAWRIPRAAEPGELPPWGRKESATAERLPGTPWHHPLLAGLPWCLRGKESAPAHAGDVRLIPGLQKCPGEGHGR